MISSDIVTALPHATEAVSGVSVIVNVSNMLEKNELYAEYVCAMMNACDFPM